MGGCGDGPGGLAQGRGAVAFSFYGLDDTAQHAAEEGDQARMVEESFGAGEIEVSACRAGRVPGANTRNTCPDAGSGFFGQVRSIYAEETKPSNITRNQNLFTIKPRIL